MQKRYLIGISLFLTSLSFADPWGKDADLVNPPSPSCQIESTSLIARWGIKAIRFHQEVISPADGPRSHYIPSSSQYTLDAMRKYGFFKGFTMGCDRLMRENNEDWVYRKTRDGAGRVMKWDPVP
jgi:putative component of membrane protein insertase Oxa1/YidC/SpoIIIJ protein YidD